MPEGKFGGVEKIVGQPLVDFLLLIKVAVGFESEIMSTGISSVFPRFSAPASFSGKLIT